MREADSGGIFISYRRQSGHAAGRLYDRLSERFGRERVFIDVDAIEPGVDFIQAINSALTTCNVVLVVIDNQWLIAKDDQGRRRLDRPNDIVRLEIEAALERNVRLIPVLVGNATMPDSQELPGSLASLARRNAFIMHDESFRYDAERLVNVLDDIVSDDGQVTPRNIVQPKSPQEEPVIREMRWKLELMIDEGAVKTFHLSSDAVVHEIIVRLSMKHDDIEVDGRTEIQRPGIHGREYSLEHLSASLGTKVTIKVNTGTWATLRIKLLILKVGSQILTYSSGIK